MSRSSTYVLIDIRKGGAALGYVIDHFEADDDDPQPAQTARRHFERRGYDKEDCRVFVMLGNELPWNLS